MEHKTRAIVLYQMPYNDKFSIVRMFTEEFGAVSYLLPQARKRNPKMPRALFFPLSVLEIEVVHRNLRDIHQLKEARAGVALHHVYAHPVKNAICTFVAEFAGKVIGEVQPDRLLFAYLVQSIKILELTNLGYANFHLVFAMRLSRFLGFFPDGGSYRDGYYFDMQSGLFAPAPPPHSHYLGHRDSKFLSVLLRMNYENMHHFRLTGKERSAILERMVEYYRLHLPGFPPVRSLEILSTLF